MSLDLLTVTDWGIEQSALTFSLWFKVKLSSAFYFKKIHLTDL